MYSTQWPYIIKFLQPDWWEQAHPWSRMSTRSVFSNLLRSFFSHPWVFSLHSCFHQYSAKYSIRTLNRSLVSSVCISLSFLAHFPANSSCLVLSRLSTLRFTLGILSVFIWFPLSCPAV